MKTLSFLLLLLLLAGRQIASAQSLTVNSAAHYAPASGTVANPDNGDELWSRASILLETNHLRISRHPAAVPAVLKLLFQNQTGSPLQLTILNDRHEPIYETGKDRRRTWGWLLFDLSALPDGQYTLHIKAAREQTERTFTLGVPHPVRLNTEPEISF